jgi:Spy/CpxP family protein refolding chaperone
MMNSIHFRFIAAAFALVLGVAILQAQHPGGPAMGHGDAFGEHMMGYLTDYLNLTDVQQKQMKDTMEREHATVKPLMQQLRQSHQQLNQYVTGTYDEAKVRAIATQQAQVEAELTVQHTRIHNELFQMLTPEQQTKAKELMAKHEARMEQHKHMHDAPAAPEQ